MERLQSVLPVELPEDLLRHLAGYLDIDTRRALRIPPGRLTSDRYAPLEHMLYPVCAPSGLMVVSLSHTPDRDYVYKRIRLLIHHHDGLLINERCIHSKGDGFCVVWRSCDLTKWMDRPL